MPTIALKLRPWRAPNFANVEDGGGPRNREVPSIPVKELPPESLNAMAQEWLEDLYAKAEKPSPWAMYVDKEAPTDER